MKHIVFYSGGIGSWATAKRVANLYGTEDMVLLFTDTMIEDEDLYRFLEETSTELGVPLTKIADGRDPWQVYKDVRFLENSRQANCSHELKQKVAKKWIKEHFEPDECVLYLGIDWTEVHRTAAPKKNWFPYLVQFPMCDEPYVTKEEMLAELEQIGIKRPRLYEMGFSHNNCGGFCCRAGQGHFARLLETIPDRYKYHEEKEQEMREYLGRDVAMMKKTVKGVTSPYTLKQLREDIEKKQEVDLFDIGGCGCFVQDEEEETNNG